MNQPTCSIVINTYNRAEPLRRLLSGLAHLRDATFEVVVVNGPSTDGTGALLQEYHGRIKAVACASRNLSESRNLGIAAAAGDVIVFIDDDALPADEHWLARYAALFASGEARVGAAGGPVWHRDTAALEFSGGATSDYGMQIFSADAAAGVIDERRWFRGVRGCNCAFRRSALVEIGGFDEFFTYYLDETDVCVRLARAGFSTVYLDDNAVHHYPAASFVRGTSLASRNWHVITRSDTYFALKNGGDPLPLRALKTIALAPRKHFARELDSAVRYRQLSPLQWLRLRRQWATGLSAGMRAGLRQPRCTARFDSPPPFVPFQQELAAPPLRIALLSQSIPGQASYGGIGRYTFDLAQGLHERGHEVHVICKDEQPLRRYSLGFSIHGIGAGDCPPVSSGADRPVLNRNLSYATAVLHRLERMYQRGVVFDVVHATNWDAEALALIRARVYPTVLMLVSPLAQVIATEQWPLTDDLRACLALDAWQIQQADTVCVPSQGVLASYESLMGLRTETLARLRRTPLGIVPALPARQGAAARRTGRHRLLFVGRCERRKGAHTLLQILPELLAARPDWECHFVGNDRITIAEGGTLKTAFLARHKGASWLPRVIFHGEVDEATLNQHYQDCDLFVAPSLFESFGLIYHEAMQYGKAVVGCRTGGVPEVVHDGVEGILVRPEALDELLAALGQLMDDEDLRERMGAAGKRRVHEQTNYRTMAAGLEQVYQQTIQAAGERSRRRRQHMWPRALPILAESAELRRTGTWSVHEGAPGIAYLRGMRGDQLSFTADAGATLEIVALRHQWSGVLEVCADARPIAYVDLFRPHDLELEHVVRLPLPAGADPTIELTLRVHAERNPASHGTEVWLRRLTLRMPLDDGSL